VVKDFRQQHPRVTLHLHQGSPKQVAEMLLSGEADIGVATEALAEYDQLVTLPCYRWSHSVVVPPRHPLLDLQGPITLNDLARFPIITYEVGYTGRSHIDNAFAQAGLKPEVVLTAMDADVIKTYVELEMGVGIVASIAVDEDRDQHLKAIDVGHLFQINLTRLGLRRNHWLPGFAYSFIQTFAPTLTREVVLQALETNR
jgi:LysR family cys regulon transcriptional activator